jgi:hypothetical protein
MNWKVLHGYWIPTNWTFVLLGNPRKYLGDADWDIHSWILSFVRYNPTDATDNVGNKIEACEGNLKLY